MSEAGGTAGMAGTGGLPAGAAGSPPFDCANPKPESDATWHVYTLEPGQCLVHGNASWMLDAVCVDRDPDDGECAVECYPFLTLQPMQQTQRVAVLPLFGDTVISACN